MIRLPETELPPEIRDRLASYQREVDAVPTYAEQVASAKLLFKSRNRADNPTFAGIRQTLRRKCRGIGKI